MAIYVARCLRCEGEALVCGPDAKGFGHGHKPGDKVMIAFID